MTRREWLALAGLELVARPCWLGAHADDTVARRAQDIVREYEAQGFHRTGTVVDRASGEWLARQVRDTGLRPAIESFSFSRVEPVTARLDVAGRHVDGIPLFDGAFTDAAGVQGRFGNPGSGADITLTQTAVNGAAAGPLGDARRSNRYKAIVAITRGRQPGLCPSNADAFRQPFGPPVLQVSSEEAAWLHEHATRGTDATLIVSVARTPSTADNITCAVAGSEPTLPPLIVMTPRSGWYWCASERGGGIVCWLEIMRAMQAVRPRRSVWFVASSGHELGHLGIDAYIERRADLVKRASGWLHLGANIGAAIEPGITLQASDDQIDAMLSNALTAAGLMVTRRTPRGTVPGGEAEAVHRGGGRYVSIIGGNGLFHNLNDRGPQAVDPAAVSKFSQAFISLIRSMAHTNGHG